MSRHTRAQLVEALPHLFYALLAFALLGVAFDAPGLGLFFLVLGGCAHVARVGVEERPEDAFEPEPALNGEIVIRRPRVASSFPRAGDQDRQLG